MAMKLSGGAKHETSGGQWSETTERLMKAKEVVASGPDLESHVGLTV